MGRCISSGDLLVVECTGFAQGASDEQQKLNFAQAVESAIQQLNSAEWLCAVNITALRPPNGIITPMDFPFEYVVDGAIEEARQFARRKRRKYVEITYLLYGLLVKNGEIIKLLFGKAGLDAITISQKIEEYVLEQNASTEPIPTRHFSECKRLAEDFAWQLGSRYVREQDMLWAIFVVGRDSEVFQDMVKKLRVNVAKLEELLAQQYPRPDTSYYGSSVFYGSRD